MTKDDPILATRSQKPVGVLLLLLLLLLLELEAPSDLPAREGALGTGRWYGVGMATRCDGRGRDCKVPGIGGL